MIYINENKRLVDEQYIVQVPINESVYFNTYKFTILNLQSKEVVSFNNMYNTSSFEGYYEFNIDLKDVKLNDGTYYYQVFGIYDDENNTDYLCTTGLCKVDNNEINTNEKIVYEKNNTNVVYQG